MGIEKGILILSMSTKPTLSFLLLTTLTLLHFLLFLQVQKIDLPNFYTSYPTPILNVKIKLLRN